MKWDQDLRQERVGQRLAGPIVFLGSLFVIAFMLYAVDTTPLRTLLLAP